VRERERRGVFGFFSFTFFLFWLCVFLTHSLSSGRADKTNPEAKHEKITEEESAVGRNFMLLTLYSVERERFEAGE
jgi:hypothetical protein